MEKRYLKVAANENISVMRLLITDYNNSPEKEKKTTCIYLIFLLNFNFSRNIFNEIQMFLYTGSPGQDSSMRSDYNNLWNYVKHISQCVFFVVWKQLSSVLSLMFRWLIHIPRPPLRVTSFSASHHNYDGPQALSLELNTSCFGGSCWNAAFFSTLKKLVLTYLST